MAILSNVLFPENVDRMRRVSELINDGSLYSTRLAAQKGEIEATLNSVAIVSQDILGPDGKPTASTAYMFGKNWEAKIPYMAAKWAGKKIFQTSLSAAATALAAQEARIASATYARLIGLPRWLAANKFTQAGIATVATDLILSAIEGGEQRAELRKMIRSLLPPRLNVYVKYRQNELLIEGLKGLTFSIQMFLTLGEYRKADLAKQQKILDDIQTRSLTATERLWNDFTEQSAKTELGQLDQRRGSHTADDV